MLNLEALDTALIEARAKRALPEPTRRRLLRERAGLSQQQVADALGVTREAVSRYESGEREPRGQMAVAYEEVLRRLSAEGVA